MRRRALLLLAILLLTVNSAFAQGPLRNAHFDQSIAALPTIAQQQPAPVSNLILGGLIGGAVGFFAGGYAGAILNDSDNGDPDELDALTGFVVGAIIGETVTLPLGVHLANKRRGNFGQSLLASAAATAVGLFIATRGEDHPEAVIPFTIVQLGASVIIEQKTTR